MKRDLPGMIALAQGLVATDTPGTLATLFSARGSTYRSLGSMMVSLPGIHAGGVSGGCLEEYVARAGERATRETPAAMLAFSTRPDSDDDVPVLGCGGEIEVLVERLTGDHIAWLKELAGACDSDEANLSGCVVTRSADRIAISRAWLPQPSGVMAAPAIQRLSREASQHARSRHASIGLGQEVLVHYVRPLTRLVIVGAGDDAQPLCELGHSLGWHVTVVDRRARLATTTRFPNADAVAAEEWDEVFRAVAVTRHTAVVLMTHSLYDDARALAQLSRQECMYLGALGPPQRREWLLGELAAQGTTLTASCQGRLCGPVGLDLGDRSPTGIAVAITAEILAVMHNRSARSLSHCVRNAGADDLRRISAI